MFSRFISTKTTTQFLSKAPLTTLLVQRSTFASLSHALVEPENEITAEERTQMAEFERDNLEIVKSMRADPNLNEHIAYSHISQRTKKNSLTIGALRGPDKLIVPPVCFYNKSYTEMTSVLHLGSKVCGHDGVIHGGLAATILDEALAGAGVPSLPDRIGFTANLNINYRKPIMADQWVVVKSKLDKAENRKVFVSANIQSLDGQTIFTEATALFVSPKVPIRPKN